MSTVKLKNDVIFNMESCDFSLEFNEKIFTSKTFDGVVKQKEEHQRMLEQREMKRSELIEVVNLRTKEEYLYHPVKKHLYKENENKFLDRCLHENYIITKKLYCEKSKLGDVSDIEQEKDYLEKDLVRIHDEINKNSRKLEGICIEVKNYKK